MVSDASRASRLADFSRSRRAVSAWLTLSLARLIAAPLVLRSSGDILPSVANSAEIPPFLPSGATRRASSAVSSPAAAIWPRISDSSSARSVMATVTFGSALAVQQEASSSAKADDPVTAGIKMVVGGYWMPRFRGASHRSCQTSQRLRNLRRQRGLGLFGDRLECRRLVDSEIGQNLAVDGDARLGQAVDEDAVGHAERTHGGIEALDPQRAEGALLALAVTEGILPGLLDRGLGSADGVLAAAVKTLGGLVDFLVLGVRGHTAFDARHDGSPLIARMSDGLPRERGSAKWDGIAFLRSGVRQEIFLDVVAVGLEQHAGAAELTNLLLGPLDHAVALAALGVHHFAGGGHLEALFSA